MGAEHVTFYYRQSRELNPPQGSNKEAAAKCELHKEREAVNY